MSDTFHPGQPDRATNGGAPATRAYGPEAHATDNVATHLVVTFPDTHGPNLHMVGHARNDTPLSFRTAGVAALVMLNVAMLVYVLLARIIG